MIKRRGLGGFVGNSLTRIKGLFRTAYSLTSVTVLPPDITDGIVSTMTQDGFGVTSQITGGDGVLSIMADDGIISTMDTSINIILSAMTPDGDGIISTQ